MLGKRVAYFQRGAPKRRAWNAPILPYGFRPRFGTRYRSLRRVGRFRGGPFRTGGFYGASVRSPAEKKVIDTDVANYTVDTTSDIVLINGEWIAQQTGLCWSMLITIH